MRQINLVDHKHVRNFQNPCLNRLNVVTEAWSTHDYASVCDLHNIDLRLTRTDRFDDHDVHSCGVHGVNRPLYVFGQTSQMTARRN